MNTRIKDLRISLGMTMEKFGERLGVKGSAINKLEKGYNQVTEQMFKSICREFNVNEEWLRDGSGEMFIIPEDEFASIASNILEYPDDEFYKLVVNILKTYDQLQPNSKEVLKDFSKKLLRNLPPIKD